MAVLELDTGAIGSLRDEADLDLAGLPEVRLELPVRADVPADDDAVRRLVGEDARPVALAAVDPAIEEVPAGARLEHRLGDVHGQQVVLARLEAAEVLGEDGEGPLDRGVDGHLVADRRALRG
jgi:hypothetical protein